MKRRKRVETRVATSREEVFETIKEIYNEHGENVSVEITPFLPSAFIIVVMK